jgi:nitrogen fixation-related uncharacterized protein
VFAALLFVLGGGLVGFVGSIPILRYRFARQLVSRPNGDVSRSRSDERSETQSWQQPWQTAVEDTKVFQFQNALRRNLISREEFRELRNKYLIPGNFAFSILVPISLALVLIAANSAHLYQMVPVSLFSAVLTALLVTYAVDRRHHFRSEYRTLIVQNLATARESNVHDQAPTGDPTSSMQERLVELAFMLAALASSFRPASTSGTEGEPGEKGRS